MGDHGNKGMDQSMVEYKFGHAGKRSSAVKPVQCYRGAHGNLKETQADAAADIISQAGFGTLSRMFTDRANVDSKNVPLVEAICWAADQLRTPPKRQRRKRA